MFRELRQRFGLHPRAWLHSALTYSRFIGRIKPGLLAGTEAELRARLAASSRAWEPVLLEVPVGQRIVVIAPHPDDESIGAGGLLLAHRGKASVNIVTLFNGVGGGQLGAEPWIDTPAYKSRLANARKGELAEVAARLQASSTHAIDLPDGYAAPRPEDAQKLRSIVSALRPDVVLIPWFLDDLPDHRMANLLYAAACADLDCMVLGFEVWSLCHPNALFDTTAWLDEKLRLVDLYRTQTATVDYARLVTGLSLTRGFHLGAGQKRACAAEAFLALPNRDYCDIVRAYYGTPGSLSDAAKRFFRPDHL